MRASIGTDRAGRSSPPKERTMPTEIYLKNYVLPEGDDPPMGDAEWQPPDEPAVRIR
jgi:hypothetical protein